MAEGGYGWAAPPPLPSYDDAWNGGDQPPSYDEVLMGAGAQQVQAPPVFPNMNSHPAYPPLPNYQPPGASTTWSQSRVSQDGQRAMAPTAGNAVYPNPAYPPLPNYQPSGPSPAWCQNTVAQDSQRVMGNDELLAWWRTVQPWANMSHSPHTDSREMAGKVQRVLNALQLYGVFMRTHGEALQNHITELLQTSNNISRSSDARKVAGVTGGTTKAVGGAVAVTGVVLAPFTMGASLAITALGVGVAAAGGITKAKIKNKAVCGHDRRVLEATVQDYRKKLSDIEACLRFIHTGMENIKQINLSVMKDPNMDTGRVSRMLELSGMVARGMTVAGKSSELLRGFADGLGTFYSKKNSQKLKKGKEDKFSTTLHKVAQRLQNTLNDLRGIANSLKRF